MSGEKLYIGRADGDVIGEYSFVDIDGAEGFFEWEDEPVECIVYRLVDTGERRTYGPVPTAEAST